MRRLCQSVPSAMGDVQHVVAYDAVAAEQAFVHQVLGDHGAHDLEGVAVAVTPFDEGSGVLGEARPVERPVVANAVDRVPHALAALRRRLEDRRGVPALALRDDAHLVEEGDLDRVVDVVDVLLELRLFERRPDDRRVEPAVGLADDVAGLHVELADRDEPGAGEVLLGSGLTQVLRLHHETEVDAHGLAGDLLDQRQDDLARRLGRNCRTHHDDVVVVVAVQQLGEGLDGRAKGVQPDLSGDRRGRDAEHRDFPRERVVVAGKAGVVALAVEHRHDVVVDVEERHTVAVIHHALARGGSHEAAANDVDLHSPWPSWSLSAELPLTLIGFLPSLSVSSPPGVRTYLHTHTSELVSAAWAGAESATRPTVAMMVAAPVHSTRRAADMGVMLVVVVMVNLARRGSRTERMIPSDLIDPICPTSTTALL